MGTSKDTVIVPIRSSKETNDVPVTMATNGVPSYAMEWLRGRLRDVGVTPAAFARALGLPKARAYEMIKGTRRLQPGEISTAARILQMAETELVARLAGQPPGPQRKDHEVDISATWPLRQGDTSLPPLVVYRTALVERGRPGDFMLRAERVGEVVRPDFLRYSEKAFAAKVLDDSNSPAYRRRDQVLVDPDSPSMEDEDCLFTGDPQNAAGTLSVIGCLISSTATHWIIRQYAVRGERQLSRSDYPNAWPIVGRYNRR